MIMPRSDPPADHGCRWEESDSHYQHLAQFGEFFFVNSKVSVLIQNVELHVGLKKCLVIYF